jgi:porphobilinogen synthase
VEARGLNPLRGRAAVRRFLHRPLLQPIDLVMPLLVTENGADEGAARLPTCTLDEVGDEVRELSGLGLGGVKLFAAAERKDAAATEATSDTNLMNRAIRAAKQAEPGLCVLVETCICAYSADGHCMLLGRDGTVDRDRTSAVLAEMAVLQAAAGADVIGPAGMVDGAVGAVRAALDEAGCSSVSVMPHLIVDSCLYRMYRRTMNADPAGGHRRAFHIDPSQPEQVLQQAQRFIDEGSDMLLLEPALPLLDVLSALRPRLACPITAFSVSGEYLLLRGASRTGIGNNVEVMIEFLGAIKRAGADAVLTYAAKEVARALVEPEHVSDREQRDLLRRVPSAWTASGG